MISCVISNRLQLMKILQITVVNRFIGLNRVQAIGWKHRFILAKRRDSDGINVEKVILFCNHWNVITDCRINEEDPQPLRMLQSMVFPFSRTLLLMEKKFSLERKLAQY